MDYEFWAIDGIFARNIALEAIFVASQVLRRENDASTTLNAIAP